MLKGNVYSFVRGDMRKGTSGVWVAETEDKIQIGYEDYGVSQFGGADFECTYTLTGEYAIKFRNELAKVHTGSLEEVVRAVFSEEFSDNQFVEFCKKNNIEYSQSTWISGGFGENMDFTSDNQQILELLEKLKEMEDEDIECEDKDEKRK